MQRILRGPSMWTPWVKEGSHRDPEDTMIEDI